jgi:hypothetical protein
MSDNATTAAVGATVTDLATGQPLQGAAVTAGAQTATTDATGSAVFSGLPSNLNRTTPITISVTAAGYPPAQTTTALLACGTMAAANVLLAPGSIAGFGQQIVNLSSQIEQGQISDDDFLLQFSNLLHAIDGTPNGPQLLQTYLNDVVLAPALLRHRQYPGTLSIQGA